MEQNEKNKTSFFPWFMKVKTRNKLNGLWLTVSSDCLLLFLLTIFAWEREAATFTMWSTGDAHILGRVSKNWSSLGCLRLWGFIWSFYHYEDLRREISLVLFLLTIRVSGEHKSTYPWGPRHRLPGSALTVTPWLVSPVNEVNIYVMWLWEYWAHPSPNIILD